MLTSNHNTNRKKLYYQISLLQIIHFVPSLYQQKKTFNFLKSNFLNIPFQIKVTTIPSVLSFAKLSNKIWQKLLCLIANLAC